MLLLLFCSMHTICTNQSHTARKTISHNEMHSTGFNMTSISNKTEKLEARIKISQSWPIICTFCLHLYITFYITCSKGAALHISLPLFSLSFCFFLSLPVCVKVAAWVTRMWCLAFNSEGRAPRAFLAMKSITAGSIHFLSECPTLTHFSPGKKTSVSCHVVHNPLHTHTVHLFLQLRLN